jgi:ribonuclease VapC
VILDSSALVAVVLGEPAAPELLAVLAATDRIGVGAPTLVEAGVVVHARAGQTGTDGLARVVSRLGAEVIAFTEGHRRAAVDAFIRFGKGRHPAALNLGDCYAYATAGVAGRPLLCLGDDFPLTDLPLVRHGN